jgi:ubiquinol-cytochrome c reductase cytochrome c1 subunit
MKKYLIALMMVLLPLSVQASVEGVHLDSIEVDLENKASLQRGMATFVNRCLGCHSADYQRYERAANDLDIPNELAEEYLLLGNQKIGEQMKIAMDKGDAANWFGNPPPDLAWAGLDLHLPA